MLFIARPIWLAQLPLARFRPLGLQFLPSANAYYAGPHPLATQSESIEQFQYEQNCLNSIAQLRGQVRPPLALVWIHLGVLS